MQTRNYSEPKCKMQLNEETGTEKRNFTHLLPQFLKQLQENTLNLFSFQRLLRYSYSQLQVFCTVRRRMLISRNYCLSKGNPLNNRIEKAWLTSNYLVVTLRPENQKGLVTKVVDLHTNTDIGELAHSDVYHRWVELSCQLSDDPAEPRLIRFAAVSDRRVEWIVAGFSRSNSKRSEDGSSNTIRTSLMSHQTRGLTSSTSKIWSSFRQLTTSQYTPSQNENSYDPRVNLGSRDCRLSRLEISARNFIRLMI